jgi:hypothetical protein
MRAEVVVRCDHGPVRWTAWRLTAFVMAAVSGLSLSGCASAPSSRGAEEPAHRHAVHRVTTTTSSTTTTIDPGALPQTDELPAADTPQFSAEMDALWQGVVSDSVQAAMPSFFPERAYVQVKAIADPEADFQSRLVGEFGLDLGAAHALLGVSPSSASLVTVDVPSQFAHWVPPGTCANRFGYFEVPNSRVVYSENGQTRSFGIASLISWRGVWYVVHLGAVVRSTQGGVVDDPEPGPGASAPSSTC